jgi:hypothetical protein
MPQFSSPFFKESASFGPPSGESSMPPEMSEEVVTKIEDLPDGSKVYEIADKLEKLEEERKNADFYENLAEKMPEEVLGGISAKILEGIEQDKESRTEWEQAYLNGLKYLGLKLETFKDVPFMTACRAFDTTLSTAIVNFYSRMKPLLFPRGGPSSFEILGEADPDLEDKGTRIKEWLNYYLVHQDKDYYPDSDRLLIYIPLVGCIFRKTYRDPITKMPITRMIDPQDFIVNNNCVTILSSDRLTHLEHLSKQDIKLRQLNGFYREVELPGINDTFKNESETQKVISGIEGINTQIYEDKSLFDVYEVHTYLSLEDFDYFEKKSKKVDIPLPYIVSICSTTHKVLSIYRNWNESDEFFRRKEYFTQYNYFPGYGLYGMGLTHLIGTNQIVLTSLLRQLIDKGTLCNFPGGLKVKGLRIENNDKPVGPGEFLDVETGGLPIQHAVMPMPYSEPSVVLKELWGDLRQSTQTLASTSESQIVEHNVNAPVQTTLALLEVTNRFQKSVFESIYTSLSNELNLMYDLFAETLPNKPYPFFVRGKTLAIMRQDFSDKIHVLPISDPNHVTETQRIFKAKSLLEMAQMNPQIYNMREVNKRVLETMNIHDIEEVLMPTNQEAEPLDPISENMNGLQGKPLQAAMWQDHSAHILSHSAFLQDPNIIQNIPEVMRQPVMNMMTEHIQQHNAMQYLLDMQMQMHMQMPEPEMLKDPEVQNTIAIKAAQVAQAQLQAQAEEQKAQQIDPNQVLMADIEQRREAAYLKDEETKLKAETEAFKSQLKFEGEKYKINSQKEIAREKNAKDRDVARFKVQRRR